MINKIKKVFLINICLIMASPELFSQRNKSKIAEICLSLPDESKIAKKMLEPPMRVTKLIS